jgi:hypothetical protein
MGMKPNTKTKDKAAPLSTILLRRDLDGEPFGEKWDYRSVIEKLNFLEKSTCPEIVYAVHQCTRFSANPRQSHATSTDLFLALALAMAFFTPCSAILTQSYGKSIRQFWLIFA